MQIKFTDVFNKEFKDILGVTIRESKNAISDPSDSQEINVDGLNLHIITKELNSKELLLFILRKEIDQIFVDYGFRIKYSENKKQSVMRPISVLQQFIEKYGLSIRIDESVGKIFLQEEIKVSGNDPSQFLEIINPENHSYITSFHLKISDRIATCALVFALDKNLYIESLHDH